MRILVIEDDRILGQGICMGLRQLGETVDWVQDGVTGDEALQGGEFDAVVLDLGLPRMPGLEVLQRLRRRDDHTPVLILTAQDAVEDRVQGLDAGADDYLGKPFDLDELAARLRALARRRGGQAESLISFGPLTINPAGHEATCDGTSVELTPREFSLLEALMRRAGEVLDKERLHQLLYDWNEDIESNAVEVHIHHLRKKIGSDLIRTVRGIGYRLQLPDEASRE